MHCPRLDHFVRFNSDGSVGTSEGKSNGTEDAYSAGGADCHHAVEYHQWHYQKSE